ncbi:hypothetical protein SEUCBS139899_002164 [Sporothrix eucalyptigena]|uniref:Yeast cell wall synthesis Kre9/Knh1-like N-terminal domain-containing protein n=1 Tax=Sporothrix eucalyptigena TaxID=1812306 RepID=A0ABP0B4R3_9PEZI
MPSFTTLASLLAFVAAAAAQDPNFDSINTPIKNAQVQAGQPFTITWTLLSATTPTGPVTITLIGGPSTNHLDPIAAIGHVQNQDLQFVWNVDASLGAEPVYGLNFTLDADNAHFQYSQPFQIVGGAAVSSSSSGSASATSSSTGSGSSGSTATSVTTTTSTPTTTTTVSSTSAATTSASNTGEVQKPTNGTASHTASPTTTGNKTTATAPPKETSGATGLSAVSAMGALAVALVASAAMHWGL